jgi:hypothetical protein
MVGHATHNVVSRPSVARKSSFVRGIIFHSLLDSVNHVLTVIELASASTGGEQGQ